MRLAVGIPSYQEADSIGYLVSKVDEGLACLAESSDCVIVNVDSASPDRTSEVFLNTPTRCRKESFIITEQPRGKGRNVLHFFRYAVEQEVAALAIVDADVRSITPEWIEALLAPVLSGSADYVVPFYRRSRFDGDLTKNFAYPIMLGYFGVELRQPIGGEFGFSPALARHLMQQPVDEAILGYGIDIFMTMHSVAGDFKLATAQLGRKLHKRSFEKWPTLFRGVMPTAITVARQYSLRNFVGDSAQSAVAIDESQEYALFQEAHAVFARERAQALRLAPVYYSWLGEESAALAVALASESPCFSGEVWADLLAACIARAVWMEHETPAIFFAEQLIPALLMRVITFWDDNWRRAPEEVEAEIIEQAHHFREKLLARARSLGKADR